MMHKKARKQFAEDKQTKDMDYWNHVLWSDETKINAFGSYGVKYVCGNQVRSTKTNVSCLQSSMVTECRGLGLYECYRHWGATIH